MRCVGLHHEIPAFGSLPDDGAAQTVRSCIKELDRAATERGAITQIPVVEEMTAADAVVDHDEACWQLTGNGWLGRRVRRYDLHRLLGQDLVSRAVVSICAYTEV